MLTSRSDPGAKGIWLFCPISPVNVRVEDVLETCLPLGTIGFDSSEAYLALKCLLGGSLCQLGITRAWRWITKLVPWKGRVLRGSVYKALN
jgi:hypothetical protein